MGKLRRIGMVAAVAVLFAGVLAACRPNYDVTSTSTKLTLPCGGGTTVDANWFFPVGVEPSGLVWVQHGFARSKDNVADLSRRYATRGYVVVAPSLAAFGACNINDKAMHQAVADVLLGQGTNALQQNADAAAAALGRPATPLPTRFVLSGHSAGGALATVVGGLVASNPSAQARSRLAGLVLLDPVENADNGMRDALPKLAGVPILTVSGPPGTCNANASGTAALQAARSGWVGVRLPTGCHCDAEGDSTDALCTLVCGTPSQANKDALRTLAVDWADDLLRGQLNATAYPGGTYYEQQLANGTIVTLNGTA